jgi:N-acyl-D-aspartate/D-glutamate deacylase
MRPESFIRNGLVAIVLMTVTGASAAYFHESPRDGMLKAGQTTAEHFGRAADGAWTLKSLVGHCAVRYWAMARKAWTTNRPAPRPSPECTTSSPKPSPASALGFSTSRTILHRTPEGQPVPGTFATSAELMGIAKSLGESQRGLIEAAPGIDSGEPEDVQREVRWMTEVSLATGRPVTFGLAQPAPS